MYSKDCLRVPWVPVMHSMTYLQVLQNMAPYEPFLWALLLWHLINTPWMAILWCQHTYQICQNLSTNELWNYKRYNYMKDPNTGAYFNFYDRGYWANIQEAFTCDAREILRRTRELPLPVNPEGAEEEGHASDYQMGGSRLRDEEDLSNMRSFRTHAPNDDKLS
jgi:hypothetical protein